MFPSVPFMIPLPVQDQEVVMMRPLVSPVWKRRMIMMTKVMMMVVVL